MPRLDPNAAVARRYRPLAVSLVAALGLAAARPATAQTPAPQPAGVAAPRPAPVDAPPVARRTVLSPAPFLTVLGASGVGSNGLAADLVGRYTYWLSPTLGLGPELFTGAQVVIFGPEVDASGGDLNLALRRPGRIADLLLRGGVGLASYARHGGGGGFLSSSVTLPPGPSTGAAATAVAEANIVFHPCGCLGLVLGGRGEVMVPGQGLGPWWGAEAVVGMAFTHPLAAGR